jgi:Na+-driven multidrug efflux pump
LASAIRGTGNMALPAQVICGGVVVLVPLSPCLIFGIGPFPALGVAGGGVAILAYYLVGSLIFARHLANGAGAVSFRWVRPQWRYFRDILSVGAVAILVTLQTYLTISFATAEVGQISPQAVAGFGTGNRLEYLLVPLIFGLGGPLVAIVGTCIGAGKHARAIRAAWLGAAVSTALAEAIGIAASLWPVSWLGLFGHDAAMLESGAAYLRIVGPFYGFFGLGMALYFASQGAGRLLWPLTAGVFRLLIVVGCGAASLRFGFGLRGLFFSLAAGLTVFGLVNAASVARGTWVRKTA